MDNIKTFKRDLFEIENARNLTRDELVDTFVPTKSFWRLLSAKNHIILGSRGSGKTAIAKMLSHNHLSCVSDVRAENIIRTKSFIGIYVPTSIEWVGGLKNKPWQTEREAELFFQWRLNISTCLAFLISLKSCLVNYYPDIGSRARIEGKLISKLAESWTEGEVFYTIRELQDYLEDIEHKKQKQLTKMRILKLTSDIPVGMYFENDLFNPLKRAINLTNKILEFPDNTIWLLCLDEAEFLEPLHHRILNTYLRAYSGNLFFKITTMPYYHHTLETNVSVPLNVGHDFEYVYIDKDPVLWAGRPGLEGFSFASSLFNKRAAISGNKYTGLTLSHLFGPSLLLEPKKKLGSIDLTLLNKYGSDETIERVNKLINNPKKLSDEIYRKIIGALILKHAVAEQKGHKELDVYSGAKMVVRCGDANPRRLIRLYNKLLLEIDWKNDKLEPRLSPITQSKLLIAFSSNFLNRLQSEPKIGNSLYDLIKKIGNYMASALHDQPLTTDQISSVSVDENISLPVWNLIKESVALGILYPNINTSNPDEMPNKKGKFRLAYILSPHFKILPRRGVSRNINTILVNDSRKYQEDLFSKNEEI